MDQENSQGKRLIEVMAQIRRVSSKHQMDDIIPHREFHVLEIINSRMQCRSSDEQEQLAPPGIKVSELSEILHITMPSVSQMINGLEEKGYVKRVTTKNDRRVVYLTLDVEGEAALKKAKNAFLSYTNELVARLGHEETEQFITLCTRLYEIIGDMKSRQS
ncbi:MarR family winged helix-turn-helix transcriptional regulator [Paenibacillus spongiae]|uniref:MarR family transcriptional regulator n=1 Tax=Paenibacillus spongiae TaxID=2909671 RepID=A0ABY5S4M9_9BACL|nr:MarR family transcriptional regulator [Paenibacillus spongiae]UVI28448.1 MarR family transcriptional regulator [Paenibacillus spongiae]